MDIIKIILTAPSGISAGEIEKMTKMSRPTINRRIAAGVDDRVIVPVGEGAARKYINADPFLSVRNFFESDYASRPFARYDESFIDFNPSLDSDEVDALINHATDNPFRIDRRDMVSFLVDFSCASSVLEGGTYSLLDTQSLIEYGENATGKPLSDAYLVMNHKRAFEYIYDNRSDGRPITYNIG